MTPTPDAHDVQVFVDADGRGGNRTIVLECAGGFDARCARSLASRTGGEITCIYREAATPRLRFFLPTSEMAFCGHGLLGAAAVLYHRRAVLVGVTMYEVAVTNRSGLFVELMSALGEAMPLDAALGRLAVAALGLDPAQRATWPVVNAGADRPKTLVPLRSVEALQSISTSETQIADVCSQLGTTGLFPFVRTSAGVFEARQFPRNAGFLEDAASGTAAIALASALGEIYPRDDDGDEPALQIRQGVAMGSPSELFVRWLGDGRIALGGRVRVRRAFGR